jgi:glutathione synthase
MGVARFPQFAPPTVVTRRDDLIREFLGEHRDVILKPLDGMGGASVFRVRHDDPNLNVIVETVTHHGGRTIMAQRYLPEIRDGDKRVLLIGGKPAPYCLARIPKPGETRGNLAAGGTGVARKLTARDREIAETLAPQLEKEGLLLVGLDVIGDFLTEVNVTSPTCFQEITEQSGFNVAGMMLDALERAV